MDLLMSAKWVIKGKHRIAPTTLSQTWANAVNLASLPAPTLANKPVTHVPILAPNIMIIAISKGKIPAFKKLIAIPVTTVLDCIIAVIRTPTKKAYRICWSSKSNICFMTGVFVKGVASLSNPTIAAKIPPNPIRTKPVLLIHMILKIRQQIPVRINGITKLDKSKEMNPNVNVVPIFVPKIIPIVCGNTSNLVETKPMVIIITAELLCKMLVTIMPANIPLVGVCVTFFNHRSSFFPEIAKSPMRIHVMPSKKMTTRIIKIPI